ncbi:MAG: DNA internalization-related competence protein ComEC/Rec2 [Rubrivivax sp.]|nr:DNA internalization-related competence protein ComEC/Rec2 [Rubrivivax sp.]
MASLSSPAPRASLLALGWLGGLALQFRQPALWPDAHAAALAMAALLGAVAAWRWRRYAAVALLLALCAGALGFATTSLRAATQLQQRLPAALEGVDLVVTGIVAELPRAGLTGTRFVLAVESATRQAVPVALPPRLSLGWYRGPDDDALLSGPAEDVRAGQRWRLPVRLRQPHGSLNPGGFDLELWMFERGLGASGYVRALPASPAVKLADAAGAPIERLRQALRDALQREVGDGTAAGVLAALLIGDQAAIDRAGWDLFRLTGVAHLMSISGLHVTMFAWLAGGIVGWLWRRHPRLPLWRPAPQAARWGGLFAAAGYALLAGWGVPAQRTVGMIAVVVALRSAGVRWPLPGVLGAAALAVTAADPWAMLQPGFWLSFVAVALLVASEPAQGRAPLAAGWRARAAGALRAGLRTQTVATVGLAPLTLVFFQQVSLVGFAANLVAIPLVTLLIVPLAMAGVLLPPLWSLAAALVQGLMALLQALAGLPLALWSAAEAPPWAMACGLLAGALAVLPLPWRLRLLALPLALPLLMPPLPRPAPGQFELVAVDVGQGTAVLVRTRGHLLLYDTGPAYTPEADAGGRVLLPLLRARGETRVDVLVLSHRDTDHVGGAASLLTGIPVAALSSSLADVHPLLEGARQRGLPHRPCLAGRRWQWDGVQFELLHPTPTELAVAQKPNAVSCVLRVQAAGGASALITGDIEAAQEAALLQRSGAALRSDVLLVPHHGSRTSSMPAFLDTVQPGLALVQAGYRSRYGHPAPEVLARYERRGIPVLRSDRCGAWTWPAAGAAASASLHGAVQPAVQPAVAGFCERFVARRYWHHPTPDSAVRAPS